MQQQAAFANRPHDRDRRVRSTDRRLWRHRHDPIDNAAAGRVRRVDGLDDGRRSSSGDREGSGSRAAGTRARLNRACQLDHRGQHPARRVHLGHAGADAYRAEGGQGHERDADCAHRDGARLQSEEPICGGAREGRRFRRQAVVADTGNVGFPFWPHRPEHRSAGVERHFHDATRGALLPSAGPGREGFSDRR